MFRYLFAALFLIAAPFAGASEDVNENPLTATVRLEPSRLQPGANGTLKIAIELAPHHKAYTDMFKLRWVGPDTVKLGTHKVSPTFKFTDKFSKKEREAVKDKSEMTAALEIPEGFTLGEHKGTVELTYQACSEEYCLFPKTLNLDFPFTAAAVETKAAPPPQASAPATSSGSAFDKALERGLFFTFLFVFLAGVATSLTPCIFPMIPITLAVIGAKTQGQTKARSFMLSLAYVFGIAITYAMLGVVAAKTGALFGAMLGNVYVVSAIAMLFVAMGLSMYGVFELRVPAFIGDRLSSTKTERGFKGAFVTGLIAGIVASPCVGPVLVSVLTYVAQTQNLVLGFFLLFTFALGVGQLFLVLGTFSSLTQKLPRSGGWMDGVKFMFGTTMIAMALYYLYPVANPRVFASLVAIALILISSAYGAFDGAAQLESATQRMRKAIMLTMFVIGVGYSLKAVFGPELMSLPMVAQGGQGAQSGETYAKLNWQDYSDEKIEKARASGQPVIIDFWADWCAACKELEHITFVDPRVQDESKKFLLLKVNATTDSEEIQRLKKVYRVVGLPTMIFITASGEIQWDNTLTGFEDADAFLRRMSKAQGLERVVGSETATAATAN
ncbi:MAG TPA: protein-disulfide reductase DsbD [Bdellovibrionales bacterium]|nr:protein-disulfide reductase DsbD [Bdellovibrionales bacterium]